MNKLIKLIIVNIMGILNYNDIAKEIDSGVKGKNETRAVLVAIVSLIYGSFLFYVFNFVGNKFVDRTLIYFIGFLLSTIICFIVSFMQVGPIIFKSEDSEYLFSLPLTKHQIIFSKLFNVYIRNMFYVLIVMIPCILSYAGFVSINETIVLLYIISCLFIPFIPILISVLVNYFSYVLKFKYNKIVNLIIKGLFIILVLCSGYCLINVINFYSIDLFMDSLYEIFRVIYPTGFLFVNTIVNTDVITFIVYLIINILVILIYMYLISNQYRKICSMLKGIKLNNKFKFKNNINLGRRLGLLKKEMLFVLNNKLYFKSSYGMLIAFTIMFILGIVFVDVRELIDAIDNFDKYYSLYCPFILGGLISLGNSTINSISLEKNSIDSLVCLPVKVKDILFNKWLCNVVTCSLFILFYGTVLNVIIRPNVFVVIFTYLLPLIVVMLVSLVSLLLDYKYVVKNEINDSSIIKQRFISLIPFLISILIIVLPTSFNIISLYKNLILAFMLVCIILMLILMLILYINRNKLRRNLIN